MGEEGHPARDRLAFALVGATGEPVESLRGTRGAGRWIVAAALLVLFGWWMRSRVARRSPSA